MKAELISVFGSDLMVVNTARVSMDNYHEVFDPETDTKLIKYLAREGHWSPFAHPKIQLRITLPIFIARQYEKHRIGCVRGYDIYDHNEVSRRYVDTIPQFFTPDTWRSRPEESIKQGSGEVLPFGQEIEALFFYNHALEYAQNTYQKLLDLGVAPEQARIVLPQSMMTSWIETGSLVFYSRLCRLRLDSHAQQEIQQLAMQISDVIRPLFPVSWNALIR